MITIIMAKWKYYTGTHRVEWRREPMAVLDANEPRHYPSLTAAITDYAEGKLPPHYPVPMLQTVTAFYPDGEIEQQIGMRSYRCWNRRKEAVP